VRADKNTLGVFREQGKHGDGSGANTGRSGQCPMIVTSGHSPLWAASARPRRGEHLSNTTSPSAGSAALNVIRGRHTGIPFPPIPSCVRGLSWPPPEEVSVPQGPFVRLARYYPANNEYGALAGAAGDAIIPSTIRSSSRTTY